MKKQFNKKTLVWILPVLALAMVSAVAVYYAVFSVTLNVNQPIDVTGDLEQSIECDAGETCAGTPITISNDGDEEKPVVISNDWDEDNENIIVSYVGELELTEKIVNFTQSVWEIPEDADKVTIRYVVVGKEFRAEVTDGAIEGYELIYYKDNSDRFSSPAKAIKLSEITGNLPYEDDQNADEYDYCETGEYSTCHGAKLWYVPSDAVNEDESLDWSRASEFYYETSLIQYNSDGELIVYPGSSITFIPVFEVNQYVPDWTGTITTQVA